MHTRVLDKYVRKIFIIWIGFWVRNEKESIARIVSLGSRITVPKLRNNKNKKVL